MHGILLKNCYQCFISVKFAINRWGSGEVKIKKNKKIYEQTNLQLNIEKSKKFLKWKPKFSIKKVLI